MGVEQNASGSHIWRFSVFRQSGKHFSMVAQLGLGLEFAETIIKKGLYAQILECPEYWAHPDCNGHVKAAIGHDLWLTSQGHGVGFWYREALPEELGEALTDLCKYQGQHPYTSKGWIYM